MDYLSFWLDDYTGNKRSQNLPNKIIKNLKTLISHLYHGISHLMFKKITDKLNKKKIKNNARNESMLREINQCCIGNRWLRKFAFVLNKLYKLLKSILINADNNM